MTHSGNINLSRCSKSFFATPSSRRGWSSLTPSGVVSFGTGSVNMSRNTADSRTKGSRGSRKSVSSTWTRIMIDPALTKREIKKKDAYQECHMNEIIGWTLGIRDCCCGCGSSIFCSLCRDRRWGLWSHPFHSGGSGLGRVPGCEIIFQPLPPHPSRHNRLHSLPNSLSIPVLIRGAYCSSGSSHSPRSNAEESNIEREGHVLLTVAALCSDAIQLEEC
jgi:hypothetical protein